MKKLLQTTFLLGCMFQLNSQILSEEVYYPQPLETEPCYYTSYSLNTNGEIETLQTEAVMVEEWTTPLRGRIIDFTLLKADDNLILLVEIHEDAQEVLQPICFGSKTKITFELSNGKKVTLPQFGPKRCGYVNIADDESPYYNITNLGYFLISENAANKLLTSETYLGSINSNNYNLDFVFKSEIYDEVNEMMIYPELYFLSELQCMLNPILPKD
ncbi:hypothetical protein [Psychroflexus planctonicus]|nr:hypothetical protein [Psychroflexus planctonicus]